MGLYEYTMLSENEQWDMLWDKGKHLTNLKLIDAKYSLYSLYAFFVEVELDVLSDKILGKKVFVTGHLMDKYVGNIDI